MLLFQSKLLSQINLIENGGFEKYSNLNCNNVAIHDYAVFPSKHVLDNWETLNSSDYFTAVCTSTNTYRGVPINDFGSQYSKNGQAYVGIEVYYDNISLETKEYIYQNLNNPLKQDSIYCLSFFISYSDRTTIAIKNIGAYFSVNSPNLVSNSYVNAIPQVLNTFGFLTDTVNWIEIQGCFVAQGGEKYITIGNFNSNTNTDTLITKTSNPFPNGTTNFSYYYIDSISLWQNNFPTQIKESGKNELVNVYPNPAKDVINFKFSDGTQKKSIEIYDAFGNLILIKESNSNTLSIITDNLANGVYFYTIKQYNATLKQVKFVIIK